MKLRDLKGLFKTAKIKFIEAKHVADDYYEVRLKAPQGLTWRAGEHAIFMMPDKKIEGKTYRAFSIASTSDEGVILLGFRTGKSISSFKKTLISLNPDEEVKMRGPFGWFTIQDDTSPMVMIALGVGVTPIRALLKQLGDTKKEIEVIYASNYYLFKDEINALTDHQSNVNVHYVQTIEETQKAYTHAAKTYGNKAYYYISGNKVSIDAISSVLKKLGIKKSRLIFDPFLGY